MLHGKMLTKMLCNHLGFSPHKMLQSRSSAKVKALVYAASVNLSIVLKEFRAWIAGRGELCIVLFT